MDKYDLKILRGAYRIFAVVSVLWFIIFFVSVLVNPIIVPSDAITNFLFTDPLRILVSMILIVHGGVVACYLAGDSL